MGREGAGSAARAVLESGGVGLAAGRGRAGGDAHIGLACGDVGNALPHSQQAKAATMHNSALDVSIMRSLLASLRATPISLAAEQPAALCRGPPPGGLRGTTESMATLVGKSDTTPDAATDLCLRFAIKMKRATAASMLPQTSRSCALVGNSGMLRGSHHGALIDGHETIVRLNFAPAVGRHVVDVGRRTTIRLLTHFPWRTLRSGNYPSLKAAQQLILWCQNVWLGVCQRDVLNPPSGRRRHAANGTMGAAPVWVLNPVLIQHLLRLYAHVTHYERRLNPRAPSTGLVGLALALSACEQVSVFGFGNASNSPNGETEQRCRYYYNCGMNERQYFNSAGEAREEHDWRSQALLMTRLVDAGAVRYYR